MKKLLLGESGVLVSQLALGTWTFAGDAIWSESSENESIRVIDAAIDAGVTLFDSSPNYGDGRSESILGKAVGNRESIMVSTKCKVDGLSRNEIVGIVENSLRRLQRESIDIMQIHWPTGNYGIYSSSVRSVNRAV